MLDSSLLSSAIDNDNSNLIKSYDGNLTANATLTLPTSSPMQQSHRDPELGNHRIVQAVCVEDQQVLEAKIISGDDIQYSKPHGSSRTLYTVVLAVVLLTTMAITLIVMLTRQKPFTEPPSQSIAPSYDQQKSEAMRAILAPLGGDGVFNENSAEFSPIRKEALDWLVQSYQQLPTNDPIVKWKLRQRYVLLLFYFSSNGPGWTESFYFDSTLDECDWSFVKTLSKEDNWQNANEFDVKGVICNMQGRVQKISMYEYCAKATSFRMRLIHSLGVFCIAPLSQIFNQITTYFPIFIGLQVGTISLVPCRMSFPNFRIVL